MKKITLLSTALFFSTFIIAQNTWVQKANYSSTSRGGACAFSIGNYGYVVTGEISPTNFISSGAKYDGVGGTWSSMNSYGGGGRCVVAAFSIGNKGYAGTGNASSGESNSFYEYNPANNTWTQKANYPLSVRFATGFSIGAYGYIAGGRNSGGYQSAVYRYDTTANTWTARASYGGGGRSGAFSFAIAGKGYMGCGQSSGGNNTGDVWEYDPVGDTWTQKATFGGTARWGTSYFTINGKGYVGCGADNTGTVNTFYEYNPSSNTWTARANYPGQGRWYGVGFNIGNRGFFTTGFQSYQSGGYTNDCWEYMPPLALSVSIISTTNVKCFGDCNGSATASASGGSGGYTYSWTSGATGTTATGLCAGTHTVYVVTQNGGSASTTCSITQPPVLTLQAAQVSTINCNGGTGSACASAVGGTPGYSYQWSNGQTFQCATSLTAATYTCMVTDANGCSTTATVNLIQPPPINLSTAANGVTSGCNGSASVTATGGTGSYFYNWTSGGQTTATATNLCAGVYTITVSDINGCSTSATVNVPSLIGISEASSSSNWDVYPNPFKEKVVIVNKENANGTVEIFNALGERVGEMKLKAGVNEIATGTLPKGMYFIVLRSENGNTVRRVFKE